MASCTRHPFDQAEAVCRRCDDPICRDCRVDARGRTWCIDCALAAAGVRSSGRSGRGAVLHRRRLNSLNATALAIREIDLRDGAGSTAPALESVALAPRPSRLNRDLRNGRTAVLAPPRPPAQAVDWSRAFDTTSARSAGTTVEPPPPARPRGPVLPPEPVLARRAGDGGGPPDDRGPEPDQPDDARRRLLAALAGVGVVGTIGAIASACGSSGSGGAPRALAPPSTSTTARTPAAPRRTPSLPSTRPPRVVAPREPAAPAAPGRSGGQGGPGRAPARRTPRYGSHVPEASPTPVAPTPGIQPGVQPGPGPAPLDPAVEAARQARLIERITFGPTPELVAEVAAIGSTAFLEQQLSLPPAPTSGVLTGPSVLGLRPLQVDDLTDGLDKDRVIAEQLRLAAVVRAVTHRGQLAEHMVAFWTNHFSTFSGPDDKNVKFAAPLDDATVIRPHAMGRFADLLLANARSVSMQLYLDNFRSNATNPNQNYARELMELHTLGAGNGYDEADVDQVARLLSGWGLRGNLSSGDDLTFAYDERRHSRDPLTVSIVGPGGIVQTWSTPGRTGAAGEQDGVEFLDWLAHLPNTALFISRKLARRFVGEDVSDALVASMAQVYLANDTQIVPVLRHLFTSAEFESSRRTKVKTPFELLVGMLRATGATIDRTADGPARGSLGGRLETLGHGMWSWPTPDGFPEDPGFWITTSTLLRRWETAGLLANGRLAGVAVDLDALLPTPRPATVGELVRAVAARLGTGIDETAASAISTYLGATHDAPTSAIDLARVRGDLVAMLLSVPAYQYR